VCAFFSDLLPCTLSCLVLRRVFCRCLALSCRLSFIVSPLILLVFWTRAHLKATEEYLCLLLETKNHHVSSCVTPPPPPFGPSTFLNLLVAYLIEKFDGGGSKLSADVASSTTMFSTGGTTAPVTHGICAMALAKEGWGSILVLDTEGLGMGNKAGLDRLVTFALLMSSHLILNTTRSLTENTLHQVCLGLGFRGKGLG
jgi:hypothetical protein